MTTRVIVCAPLRLEAARLAPALSPGMVIRTGPGPRRSRRARMSSPIADADALVVAGIGGGVTPRVSPGDVVVATEVRGPGWTIPCPGAPMVARSLHRRGLPVEVGPIASVPHIVLRQRDRERLAHAGTLCVDTESAWLLEGFGEQLAICVRVVADAPPAPVIRPATVGKVRAALRRLPDVAAALADWASAIGPRTVVASADLTRPADEDRRSAGSRDVGIGLVVGSETAAGVPALADGQRLDGARTYHITNPDDIDLRWLRDAGTVNVVAGPLARQGQVGEVIGLLRALGQVEVVERHVRGDIHITLPREVGAP